jgi:galactokinase
MNPRMETILTAFAQAFGGEPGIWVRAPGRVDLMGSHTDYNLGYVLTLPISRDTIIAARPRQDGTIRLRSLAMNAEDSFHIDSIDRKRPGDWANYIRGVAAVLREQGFPLTGLDGMIDTTIPLRSGLSSSAALECAAAVLFRALGGWSLDPVRMAQLCQRAENEFAGVSCGILDQYTSCAGQQGCALLLDCRDLSSRPVRIAPDISIVICDTCSRRELAGSEYGLRRADCELGAKLMGVSSLRHSSLQQLEACRGTLPEQVYRRCRFILDENARVLALSEALSAGRRDTVATLCSQSFRGAAELYEIVAPSMKAMIAAMVGAPGAIGARQAGAGFGGCMVAFVDANSVPAFSEAVYTQYRASTGIEPQVYAVQAAQGAEVMPPVHMGVGS